MIDASLPLIKIDDIVQCRRMRDGEFDDYASIKDDADRRRALNLVQRGFGDYRIIRRGVDAKIVLTY